MSSENIQTSELLSSSDAAIFLGCATTTLRQSRVTGTLFGIAAPKYLKIGSTVRYKLSTLKKWINQFEEQTNTSCCGNFQ